MIVHLVWLLILLAAFTPLLALGIALLFRLFTHYFDAY